MKPLDADKALRSAKSKGFREAVTKGGQKRQSDHYFLFYHDQQDRRTSWRVKVSHGAKELRASHIRSDALRSGIDPDDMFRILNCEHDRAWVVQHYVEIQRRQREARSGDGSATRTRQ